MGRHRLDPDSETVEIKFDLPAHLRDTFATTCYKLNRTRSEQLRRLIERWLRELPMLRRGKT